MALNAKLKTWLTPKTEDMALNAKLWRDDDFQYQIKNMDLNAKWKRWVDLNA